MLFCPRCGSRNAEDAHFCNKCGCSIELSSQPDYTPSTQTPWEPPADDLFPDFSDPAWALPVQNFSGVPEEPRWTSPVEELASNPEQTFWTPLVPKPGSAPEQSFGSPPAGALFPEPDYTARVSPEQDLFEVPGLPHTKPAPESDPQPPKTVPWKILLPFALLAVLAVGFFAVDWLTDRDVNLFGLLHREDGSEPTIMDAATTAPSGETTLPAPTEPMPTDTATIPVETLPEETIPQDTTPAVTEPPQTSLPVQGQIVTDYAIDELIYNPTTKDYRTHDGLDIAAEAGTPVCAAADGMVNSVYQDGNMGTTVVITHHNSYTTCYSSLAPEVSVKPGDNVLKGQAIGFVGQSAPLESAIGNHVHFSVQLKGQSVNPYYFLDPSHLIHSKAVLTEVMDGKTQLLTDSQSVMYLQEYLNVLQVNEIAWWEFVDFDQDGYPEVYAVTDSPIHSYLVLHWNGTQVRVFPFGARSMQTLKTNGWFSASSSAYESCYFRITFHDNSFTKHTLARFDTSIPVYQIDGKTVSQDKADQFLAQWRELPEVTRPGSTPPEVTDPEARCAYCGVWHPLSQMKDGLCSNCQGQVFQCQICGKWSTTVFEGYCEECDPDQWDECPCCGAPLGYGEYDNAYGMCDSCLQNGGKCTICGKLTGYLDSGICSSCQKPINTAACAYCGTETAIEDLKYSLCEECRYYRGVDWCDVCGRLSDNLFEGVCDICEPYGGRGEPEYCAHCGQPSYDLVTGLCNDCYWYVGWCSVCGNLAYEIYDGVCTDCEPRGGMDDPDEYMSQCTVCGEWSDTVFEGICDNCGGYDGRG